MRPQSDDEQGINKLLPYKMRYSTEPKFRKYVKEYGFLSIARKFGDKSGNKLINTIQGYTQQKLLQKESLKKLQKLQEI